MELEGEGVENPCHHDDVQSSPIYEWIGDAREDVVVQGVATKHEKHEVAPPLVVGRRGFQNDRDHRSYVMEAGNMRMQVHDEDDVEVGADVIGMIVFVILGNRNPLSSDVLLFHVTDNSLLLLPSEGSGAIARLALIQGLACGSHGGDENLLLLVRGSDGVVLLPLGEGSGHDVLLVDVEVGGAARYGR
jgi:hypothetical protein